MFKRLSLFLGIFLSPVFGFIFGTLNMVIVSWLFRFSTPSRVDALFRYPVKGFTPERRESLVIQSDGRVQGDRALVFRFADALEPGDATYPKSRGLALMTFPTLARIDLAFDDTAGTLRLRVDDIDVTADLSESGRARLSDAVTAYLRTTSDAKLLDADGIMPLGLIGDGVTARFQDRPRGFISLHGAASVDALDAAVPAPVDDRRFRSNIVVTGTRLSSHDSGPKRSLQQNRPNRNGRPTAAPPALSATR